MRPFSEEAIWTTFASFCVHIDKEKTESAKRERVNAIRDFCGTIGPLLLLGNDYEDLNFRIQFFEALVLALSPMDTSKSLDLLCFAKHEVNFKRLGNESLPLLLLPSTNPKATLIKEIYQAAPEELAKRQVTKTGYLESLTVKSCAVSCQ